MRRNGKVGTAADAERQRSSVDCRFEAKSDIGWVGKTGA